uniref:Uncharacterized protein n=1 Tax=Arundo donax TaxID=35708 RepID=A0A0A9GIW3_ARUDO
MTSMHPEAVYLFCAPGHLILLEDG